MTENYLCDAVPLDKATIDQQREMVRQLFTQGMPEESMEALSSLTYIIRGNNMAFLVIKGDDGRISVEADQNPAIHPDSYMAYMQGLIEGSGNDCDIIPFDAEIEKKLEERLNTTRWDLKVAKYEPAEFTEMDSRGHKIVIYDNTPFLGSDEIDIIALKYIAKGF